MSFSFGDGQSEIKGDFSKLENLIKGLKTNLFVEIGVFGSAKTGGGQSVAEYAAYNEFGSHSKANHPPKRSFIRAPLMNGQEKIEAYVKKHAQQHIEAGDIKAIFSDIGIGGESVIQEAFEQHGPGWKENAPSTIEAKGSSAPLIDEGNLRKAITHRVGGKK